MIMLKVMHKKNEAWKCAIIMTLFLVLVSCNSGPVEDPKVVFLSLWLRKPMVLKERKPQ
ncbi:hypothetical protein [Borrelia hermsii]|uniref:hypothetical protein n=1 Tax=Borrelia hermsii TaxID=140 RepID=UPI000A558779|nr:hypothetical protein [Borrelia hermsii]